MRRERGSKRKLFMFIKKDNGLVRKGLLVIFLWRTSSMKLLHAWIGQWLTMFVLTHWILPGVLAFFVLLGFFGLILHCSSLNSNDPRMAGCQNCCYGWGILDCFPASMEACFALVIVFVVIFAILGIAYGFLAATMAIQRIWQRHYHILTKRELTKVTSEHRFLYTLCIMVCCNVESIVGQELSSLGILATCH